MVPSLDISVLGTNSMCENPFEYCCERTHLCLYISLLGTEMHRAQLRERAGMWKSWWWWWWWWWMDTGGTWRRWTRPSRKTPTYCVALCPKARRGGARGRKERDKERERESAALGAGPQQEEIPVSFRRWSNTWQDLPPSSQQPPGCLTRSADVRLPQLCVLTCHSHNAIVVAALNTTYIPPQSMTATTWRPWKKE